MTREITDLIDNAVRDWETSGDAMRWAPEPPRRAAARRSASESISGQFRRAWPNEGPSATHECLFVGGPWHGRRHNVLRDGRLPEAYRVLDPPLWRVMDDTDDAIVDSASIRVVIYRLRWYAFNPFGANDWPTYCAPGVTNVDVSRAVDGLPALGCAAV